MHRRRGHTRCDERHGCDGGRGHGADPHVAHTGVTGAQTMPPRASRAEATRPQDARAETTRRQAEHPLAEHPLAEHLGAMPAKAAHAEGADRAAQSGATPSKAVRPRAVRSRAPARVTSKSRAELAARGVLSPYLAEAWIGSVVDIGGERGKDRNRRIINYGRTGPFHTAPPRCERVQNLLGSANVTDIDYFMAYFAAYFAAGLARWPLQPSASPAVLRPGRRNPIRTAPPDHAIDSSTASALSRASARCCATLTAPADMPSTLPVCSAERPATTRSVSNSR